MSSVRQWVIDNIVTTLTAENVVGEAVDSRPSGPDEYSERCTSRGFAWVFEGEEAPDETQMTDHIACDLPITVQVAYRFDSHDPQRRIDRLGREKMAALSKALHADIGRGTTPDGTQNLAFVTLEAGNSIGELDLEGANNVGILTSDWLVKYMRHRNDPSKP